MTMVFRGLVGSKKLLGFRLAVAGALILSSFILGFKVISMSQQNSKSSILKFYSRGKPSSFDPMEFDLFSNHVPQSLAHARLVTVYRGDGTPVGQIAKSWSHDESKKVWRFQIRENLSFGNGQKLSAYEVSKSLLRTFVLLKKHHSKSPIVASLTGLSENQTCSDPILGISTADDSLILKFDNPIDRLPELLSFGIFSIINPKSFHPGSGQIIDDELLTKSSGPYALLRFDNSTMQFELKPDSPRDFHATQSARKIEINYGREWNSEVDDLAFSNGDSKSFDERFYFSGRGSRNICYIVQPKWKKSLPEINSNRDPVAALQGYLKKRLIERGIKTSNSFLPTVMEGISDPSSVFTSFDFHDYAGKEISFNDGRPSGSPLVTVIYSTLEEVIKENGMVPKSISKVPDSQLIAEMDPDRPKHNLDLLVAATGVTLEDPDSDIRLMFSKEGVRLPDTDGSIGGLLTQHPIPAQKVNQKIFEQKVVWPIAHYDLSLWARKTLDLSEYHSLLPPGEFQWINVK